MSRGGATEGVRARVLILGALLIVGSVLVLPNVGTRDGVPSVAEPDASPYAFAPGPDGSWVAGNPANRFRVEATDAGITIEPAARGSSSWSLGLGLVGIGREDAKAAIGHASPVPEGNRLSYDRGPVTEWYANDERGLEQGFTIASWDGNPAGPLRLEIALSGDLLGIVVEGGQAVRFLTLQGMAALRYAELRAWDSAGRALPARLELAGRILEIVVDDSDAAYPITVDPLVFVEEAKLTASDAKAGQEFGFSVAIDGDTAVIGAPGTDDAGEHAGSAYVFVRGGVAWDLQAKLTASDAAPWDLFGASAAVDGDLAVIGATWNDDAGNDSGSAYVFVRSGTSWTEQAKLIASDTGAGDGFGHSVAVDGDTVVIGAMGTDDAGEWTGSAYVFVRSGTAWTERAKLSAPDAEEHDRFGESVAIDDDTIVVGAALNDDVPWDSGSAYVFIRNGTAWNLQAKLTASDAGAFDAFGTSVAVDGDTAVVAAQWDDGVGEDSGSAYVFVRSGTAWTQQAKLTASDAATRDTFGWFVAVEGDTAAVGARWDDGVGEDSGSAYVFVRSGTAWTQQAKLTASDAEAYDWFGWSGAVAGGTVVVGAFGNDDAGNWTGSAYVFVRSGTAWAQQAKLMAGDASAWDFFGVHVAIDGDTAVVGAAGIHPGPGFGSAYVFVRNGTAWNLQAKLTASDAGAPWRYFGFSVAIDGDTAVVTAPGIEPDPRFGAAYVFVRSGVSWTEQAKLTASDAAAGDQFGLSVAIEGGTIAIGAPGDDDRSGSAYVFVRNGTAWNPEAKLRVSGAKAGDQFGLSVAIEGGTIAVGAPQNLCTGMCPGFAHVFVRSGVTWTEQAKLTASDAAADDGFGHSIAIDADTVVVGAPRNDGAGWDSGSAYVFVRSGAAWTQQAKLTASDAAPRDEFSQHAVAIEGDTVAVGAPQDSDAGACSGSAYVFIRSGVTWTEQAKLTASDAAAGDVLGLSIAIGGDTIVVGAPGDDDAGPSSGSAYVYRMYRPANPPLIDSASASSPVDEGSDTTLRASVSDSDSPVLNFTISWGDNATTTGATTGAILETHAYGDDGTFAVNLTVCDESGGCDSRTMVMTVRNVAPTIMGDITATFAGDLTLRVAGEKWHDVTLTVYDGETPVHVASVTRYPGSPDDQAVTIHNMSFDLQGSDMRAVVLYTPDDDPINGQPNGANPAWLILTAKDGSEARMHHTFNVRHEETWTWEVEDLAILLVGMPIEFTATASDVGSDDLTFTWDWGDGTTAAATYFNDGVGPDPYPSPEVNPITATDAQAHAFASAGTYVVTLTVTDDDGGSRQLVVSLDIG